MQNIKSWFLPLILIGLAVGILFLPGLRTFYKYLPYPDLLWIIFLLAESAVLFGLFSKRFPRLLLWLANPYLIFTVFLILILVVWNGYPIADGLKTQMRGSDQDDCVILGASHLLNLHYPYTERSYFGNPCSTGPGMLLLYLPFVWIHAYALGATTVLAALCVILKKIQNSWFFVGLFLTILLSCLALDELLIVGSDLVGLGLGIAILGVAIPKVVSHRRYSVLILLGLLCGLISASRLNFLLLFPFISLVIFFHSKISALIFFASALFSSLVPSIVLYIHDSVHFTPLHLASKAGLLLSPSAITVSLCFCAILGIGALVLGKRSLQALPSCLFLILFPMLLSLALADLSQRNFDFAQWEGANYLIPTIPLVAFFLAKFIAAPHTSKSKPA